MGGATMKTVFTSLIGAAVLLSVIASTAAAQDDPEIAPSADVYNQLVALRTDLRPALDQAKRWSSAQNVGLASQPGEFESIRTQLINLEVRADEIIAQSNSDSIDAHVKRAAQA